VRSRVKISCRFCGRHEVACFFLAGGLAITPYHEVGCSSSERLCVITHVHSGLKIGEPVPFERAKSALMRLLEITDWQRTNIVEDARHENRAWVKNAKSVINSLLSEDSENLDP
jgi:hypothetical protein